MKQSLESQSSIPKEIMQYYYFSTDRICTVADSEDSKKSSEEEKFTDYQCYICYEISLNIQECKTCERIFCNRCIDDITKSKPPGTEVPCPNNCVPWALDKPHRSVRNAIETIEFYCVNHSKGCSVKLKVHNAEQHIQNECEYAMVHCLNEGCVKEMLRKDLKKHFEEECQLRKVTCEKCQILSKFSEESKHDCVTSLKEVISVQKAEIDRLNEIITSMYTQDQVNAILKGKDIEQKEEVAKNEENNEKKNQQVQEVQQPEKKKELGQEEGVLKKDNSHPDDKDEQDNQNKKKENPFQKLFQLGMKFINSSREQPSQAELPQLRQSQPQKISQLQQLQAQQLPFNTNRQKQPAAQSYALNQHQAPMESQYNQFSWQQQQQQQQFQQQQQQQQAYPYQNQQQIYQQYQYPEYSKSQQAVSSGNYQQYNPYNNQVANNSNPYYTMPQINNNDSNYSSYYQQQNQDYNYSNNNYSSSNPNGTFYYSPPVNNNNYISQQPLLLNQPGCDHSILKPIHSDFPANKICKCNQFLEKDYYYCQNCSIYMCPRCKK